MEIRGNLPPSGSNHSSRHVAASMASLILKPSMHPSLPHAFSFLSCSGGGTYNGRQFSFFSSANLPSLHSLLLSPSMPSLMPSWEEEGRRQKPATLSLCLHTHNTSPQGGPSSSSIWGDEKKEGRKEHLCRCHVRLSVKGEGGGTRLSQMCV